MKKLQASVTKVLFTGGLVIGMGLVVAPVSASPAGLISAFSGSSDVMQLASVDFKGEHRYTTHVAYERHSEKKQATRHEDAAPVMFKGKPPFNRHIIKHQPLEKVQFARFEESTGVEKAHRPIYRSSQGQRPPYRR
jgi:hypothetical protein